MEVKRETPSTLTSLICSNPQYYDLKKSKNYNGLVVPSSVCSAFSNFKTDPVYQFPLANTQSPEADTQGLISSALITYPRQSDLNKLLEDLHRNSPFKESSIFNRIAVTDYSNLDILSPSLSYASEFQDSSSISCIKHDTQIIDEKDRETISNLLTDFHRRPRNIQNLNSLTPVSSFQDSINNTSSRSQSQADDIGASLAEEGTVQRIKCTLEVDTYASKNLLTSVHYKPDLHKVPQKVLTNMNSPFTSLIQEASHYYPTSPIVRKLVFCQQSSQSDSLEIISAVATSGFLSAVNLEYSNVEKNNKAFAEKTEKILLTHPIAKAISKTSAIWFSCGFEHCAIITNIGKIMTWGYGASGCLGHGDKSSVGFPKQIQNVKEETFRYIECGGYHNIAITENSDIFVWGRGDVNQLGVPRKSLSKDHHGYLAFRPIKLDYFTKKIKGGACGEAHTVVLDEDGTIYTFGWGEDGQLGVTPVENNGIKFNGITQIDHFFPNGIVKVAAGNIFSACLTESGEVFVWGSADKGQFAKEIPEDFVCKPVKIPLEKIVDIVCGESRVICVDESGNAFGWGLGKAGKFNPAIASFPLGSELVCYSVKVLAEADIAHHVMI